MQRRDWNDEKTIGQLRRWLEDTKQDPIKAEASWDVEFFGLGVTAQEAAQRFGWSIGVAIEELEMAEDRGVLCRDEGIEGVKFWINHITGELEEL